MTNQQHREPDRASMHTDTAVQTRTTPGMDESAFLTPTNLGSAVYFFGSSSRILHDVTARARTTLMPRPKVMVHESFTDRSTMTTSPKLRPKMHCQARTRDQD